MPHMPVEAWPILAAVAFIYVVIVVVVRSL
jgi:hypothetical protein